jgi:hypothetical protein
MVFLLKCHLCVSLFFFLQDNVLLLLLLLLLYIYDVFFFGGSRFLSSPFWKLPDASPFCVT